MKRLITLAAACAALASASGCDDTPMNPGGGGGGGTTVTITVQDFQFANGDRTVTVGTKIVWTNAGSAGHTVTSDGGMWAEQIIPSGSSTTAITFNTVGTFDYHCRFHPSMIGTITVQP